jgi:hypothetical protein
MGSKVRRKQIHNKIWRRHNMVLAQKAQDAGEKPEQYGEYTRPLWYLLELQKEVHGQRKGRDRLEER